MHFMLISTMLILQLTKDDSNIDCVPSAAVGEWMGWNVGGDGGGLLGI